MKKLNTKQTKQIKAGSLTGALFGGIASCIKASFDGLNTTINTIAGWITGNNEFKKGHAKMNLKIGNSAISYDDTTKVKAAEHLASDQMKQGTRQSAGAKAPKVVLERLPENNDMHHDNYSVHHDDSNLMIESNMHLIDEFMHF